MPSSDELEAQLLPSSLLKLIMYRVRVHENLEQILIDLNTYMYFFKSKCNQNKCSHFICLSY